MISLLRALSAESLKLKRTLAIRMVLVAPLLVALLQLMVVWHRKADAQFKMWNTLGEVSLSAWGVFIFPLLITLQTALLNGVDHNEKNWKHLFALPVPRHAVYMAKLLFAGGLAAASTMILAILTLLTGAILMRMRPELAGAGAPPYGWITTHAAMAWLASWLIIAIHHWISIRWAGFVLPLGAGVAGTFFAIFASGAHLGAYYPWLLPVNVLSPERAGTALILGAGGGVVAAVVGCLEFVRRDVF